MCVGGRRPVPRTQIRRTPPGTHLAAHTTTCVLTTSMTIYHRPLSPHRPGRPLPSLFFLSLQPTCTPSRASLLSGHYPITIGFQHECIQTGSAWGLPLTFEIMPEILGQGGYHTAAVGKWDLGHYAKQLWPTLRGFDSWLGITNKG